MQPPCKRFDLAAVRGDLPVAYIGDGVSDRCVCGAADVVFARAELADWLREGDRPFIRLRGLRPGARSPRAADGGTTDERIARVTRRGWRIPGSSADWREMEARVLAFWRDEQIFARSVDDAPRRRAVRLLRGAADRQRAPGIPPRPVAGVQGRLPAVSHDARAATSSAAAGGTATGSPSSSRSRSASGSRASPTSRPTGSPSSTDSAAHRC